MEIKSSLRSIFESIKGELKEAKLKSDPFEAYVQTALWSSTDDSDNELDVNYDITDISPESIRLMKSDLKSFLNKVKSAGLLKLYLREHDLSQLAHDFWLTRNRHGAGFWDRAYSNDAPDGSDLGDAMTKIANEFGEQYLYVGDDGKIYVG